MSILEAFLSTRNVNTCPALRSEFSSVESSFRRTLFSVTTGDFKMSQTPILLIVSRLLACFYSRGFFHRGFHLCFLHRSRILLRRLFCLRFSFLLCLWLFFGGCICHLNG